MTYLNPLKRVCNILSTSKSEINSKSDLSSLFVLDILRSYYEIKEGDPEFRIKKKIAEKILKLDEKLQGVYSPFYDLLSLKVEDEAYQKLEPMQKREKTFEALRDLLIAESQKKPIILVVEDLHWIDKTSEEYLSYLIEWLEEFYEMLAYHFVQAEVWDRAVIYLREAGQRAMNKSAYMEAITNLSKALEIFQRLPIFWSSASHTPRTKKPPRRCSYNWESGLATSSTT